MLATDYKELFCCPISKQSVLQGDSHYSSEDGSNIYPVTHGKPVLVDFESSILNKSDFLSTINSGNSLIERREYVSPFKTFIKSILSPVSAHTKTNMETFLHSLKQRNSNPVVLVIGGASIGKGSEILYDDADIQVLGFDVYDSNNVHFIADAHNIPLKDESIDGILIQYVLEHVIDPLQVVKEIHRILKPEGVIYAETPFLEQVHEGAYDFTRFTESGHRYLFKNFALTKSGYVNGAGTHLLWTLEYLARGIFRSWHIGKMIKLFFFWLQYLDKMIPKKYNIDAADSVFFLGSKSENIMPPKEIIGYYQGADNK